MRKILRIIFIKDTIFTTRDYHRFGIGLLRENGFQVEMWEITPVLHKENIEKIDTSGRVKDESFHLFITMDTLVNAITDLDDSSVVHIYIPFTYHSLPIFKALSQKNIPTTTTVLGAVPLPRIYTTNNPVSRLIGKGKSIFQYPVKRSFFTVVNRFLLKNFKLLGIKPLDLCILGGQKSLDLIQLPVDNTTKQVWAHSFDYDSFLDIRQNTTDISEEYGVFIDQNIPFHPEFIYCNYYDICSPEEYFSALRKFFDNVEQECHCPVIIAAHPTSDYAQEQDYFGGRNVLTGNTARLIQNSKFVITHDSTALNFALLFRLPIIFITTDRLEKSVIQQDIDVITERLNKKPLNIDGKYQFDYSAEMIIDQRAYDRYIHDYIKTKNSQDLPLWQIYADAVRKLFDEKP